MPADSGTQTVTVKYFDPVDSSVVNKIGVDVRKVGIYSGGYLTRVNDTTVTVSTLRCEIGDGTYQVGISTAATVNVTVSSTNKYVVLRWAYTGVAADDYMEFVATTLVGIQATDVVVGHCNYSGSTLTVPSYENRATPNTHDLFLKVEPEETPSLYCRVRAGQVNYGAENFDINDQLSPLFTAPVSDSSINLLQVNVSGALIVTAGTPDASPVAPDYGGLVTLAEVTIATGATTITEANIKDVRALASSYPGEGQFVDLTNNQTAAGIKTFSSFPIVPSSAPTTDYQVANKKYVDDEINSIPEPSNTSEGTSYSAGVAYQNTTGFKVVVIYYLTGVDQSGFFAYHSSAAIGATSSPTTTVVAGTARIASADIAGYPARISFTFIVPNGWWWKITNSALSSYATATLSRVEVWEI